MGKAFLEEFCYYSNKEINTLEEAKAGMKHYIAAFMAELNPIVVISNDATKATTYAYSDRQLSNPLKTYSIQKDGKDIYELYNESQEQVGEIVATDKGGVICYGSVFKIDGSKPLNTVLVDNEVIIKVPQDGGTENDYIEVSLTSGRGLTFMLNGFVTYKAK